MKGGVTRGRCGPNEKGLVWWVWRKSRDELSGRVTTERRDW